MTFFNGIGQERPLDHSPNFPESGRPHSSETLPATTQGMGFRAPDARYENLLSLSSLQLLLRQVHLAKQVSKTGITREVFQKRIDLI